MTTPSLDDLLASLPSDGDGDSAVPAETEEGWEVEPEPEGAVASTPSDAEAIAARIGPSVVKAQVPKIRTITFLPPFFCRSARGRAEVSGDSGVSMFQPQVMPPGR